jgi:trehalose 6-phosphate synthase
VASSSLVVASNRGPLSIVAVEDGDDQVRRGGGGLVSGVQSAIADVAGALWVCAALNDSERALARRAAGGRLSEVASASGALRSGLDVRMLPIDPVTFRNAYNGIANSTLWFALHMLYDLSRAPSFDASWRRKWAAYRRYNEEFARAIAEEAAPHARVVLQDYHLFLAPAMLRERRPDLKIAHFTHIPWVAPEYFEILPDDVGASILDGLLGADLIGFHTRRWADDFTRCCKAVLGREPSNVGIFPLGSDATDLTARAARRDVESRLLDLARSVGDLLVIGRVDRTEPSKNVWRGMLAYRELLRTYPQWRGRVVHVVFDNPSREDLPEYREYAAGLDRLARDIDDEFGTDDWTPLVLEITEDYPGALAVLRRADVLFVNSVRDGMNLVVLEGVILSERAPAVVISRDMGAAETLGADALQVNPYDVSAQAQALHAALSLPEHERRAAAARMRERACRLPPAAWFQAQLDALG